METIYHIKQNWPWVWYFGFVGPWVTDYKCVPLKPSSFFRGLKKGEYIRHCKACGTSIILIRLFTSPITIIRDLISRWFWRSKYTSKYRIKIVSKRSI